MKASRGLVFAAGAAALLLGAWAGWRWLLPSTPVLQAGTALPERRPVADFVLADQDGAPFTRRDLEGHWTLLFAGYTHCPDVCPTTLAVMKAVEQRLHDPHLRMVFVSVDPERDTPEQLRRYVRYFSPDIVGATGPTAELDKLCGSLGLVYMKVAGASPQDYAMDHSAALVLVDPRARIAAYFQPPHKADTLAADLRALLSR